MGRIKSLAEASHIIERSPTILYRLGPEKPFPLTYVSQNVSRYDYDAEKLLAKPDEWLEVIDSSDRRAVMETINATVEGKTDRTSLDLRLKRPDASEVWVHSESHALRDEAGRLVEIEGVMTDLSERKRAESELSFSHMLLSTAIENSPDAILIVDPTPRSSWSIIASASCGAFHRRSCTRDTTSRSSSWSPRLSEMRARL
jgi:PAS domain S-box-containing protein